MKKLCLDGLYFELTLNALKIEVYKLFELSIPQNELEVLGNLKTADGCILLEKENKERKLNFLINKHLPDLKNRITGNSATFITRKLGLPLIGNISFGIVDRGSTLLELKPNTSCNLNCIYCSVAEGLNSRMHDFVVDRDYLVEETSRVVDFKESNDIELHINCQGEPLLYDKLTELVQGLSCIKNVSVISINTNGVLLTKGKIRELIEAGVTRFNISINTLNQTVADRMAGTHYPVKHVAEMVEYISKQGVELVIAPVMLPGYNEHLIEEMIKFAKRLRAHIGIQNFLEYRRGRNPVKQLNWQRFYAFLSKLEEKHGIKLILGPSYFNIRKCKALPIVFEKGEKLTANIICPGRYRNEVIVAARNRNITVITNKQSGRVTSRIIRTKHNIYLASAF